MVLVTKTIESGSDESGNGHCREAIKEFLTSKWAKELNYQLMKELWAYTENRISVRFEYEWKDADTGQWFRTHGNESLGI